MMLPVMAMIIIFHYIPMYGIRYAFYDFTPFSQKYIGLKNFVDLFGDRRFLSAFGNTVYLSLVNMALGTVCSIVLALLLNELQYIYFKKVCQTIVYIPHYISWVVTASIFTILLSPSGGFVNDIIGMFHVKPIYFLASEKWWTPIFLFICRWKDTGWGTIIYLAALAGVNPDLYEAASIDGAGRLKQTWHVTLPGIMNTILVVVILDLAKVLNLFESVFVLTNSMVVDVSEVIETYVYKKGLIQSDYGYSTAVGLFKSVISMILILITNRLSKKVKGEGIL